MQTLDLRMQKTWIGRFILIHTYARSDMFDWILILEYFLTFQSNFTDELG